MPGKNLGYAVAIEAMRRPGARLVCMSSGKFYVVPGGAVGPEIADKIRNHPLVKAGFDAQWPGHEQTWKIEIV